MTRHNGFRQATGPALPGRVLLIAPTVERAAVLGVAFDDAAVATPDELPGVLATFGADLPCVAVSGVPTRGGRLAEVLRQVQAACPRDVQVLIDLREPAGNDLLLNGAGALRGLTPVDRIDVWGVPCLRLLRGPDRSLAPDLQSWREGLLDASTAQSIGGPGHRPGLADEARSLRERIVELEREVARYRDQGSAPGPESGAPKGDAPRPSALAASVRRATGGTIRSVRMAKLLAVVCAGACALLAAAFLAAELTDTGYTGGAATLAVGLLCALFAYVWRGHARLVTRIERVAKRIDDGNVTRHTTTERLLASQQARLKEIEHDLAIMAASTVDIAHSVATQRTQPNAGD